MFFFLLSNVKAASVAQKSNLPSVPSRTLQVDQNRYERRAETQEIMREMNICAIIFIYAAYAYHIHISNVPGNEVAINLH